MLSCRPPASLQSGRAIYPAAASLQPAALLLLSCLSFPDGGRGICSKLLPSQMGNRDSETSLAEHPSHNPWPSVGDGPEPGGRVPAPSPIGRSSAAPHPRPPSRVSASLSLGSSRSPSSRLPCAPTLSQEGVQLPEGPPQRPPVGSGAR